MLSSNGAIVASSSSQVPTQRDKRRMRVAIIKNEDFSVFLESKDYAIETLYEFFELAKHYGSWTSAEAIALKVVTKIVKLDEADVLNGYLDCTIILNALFVEDSKGNMSIHLGLFCLLLPAVNSALLIDSIVNVLRVLQSLDNTHLNVLIQESLPSSINYLEARGKQINNAIYTFYEYLSALKRVDKEFVEKYIQLQKDFEPTHVIDSTLRIGLLTILLNYPATDAIRSSALIEFFILNTQNAGDIRYAYQLISPDQRDNSIAQALLNKLKALHSDVDPNSLLTYEERIKKISSPEFEIDIPKDFIDPVSHDIFQYPIAVGRNSSGAVTYELAELIKWVMIPNFVPQTFNDLVTRVSVGINELTNGVNIITKNLVEHFVIDHEKQYALRNATQPVNKIRLNENETEVRFFNKKSKNDHQTSAPIMQTRSMRNAH
jgi:hypothetical protein